MADLQKETLFPGQVHELFGLFKAWRQGLFHEDGDAAAKELGGDGEVMDRGHDDDRSIGHVQERPMVAVGRAAETPSQGFGLIDSYVGDASEFDITKTGQDANVFFTQMTDADHRDPRTLHEFLVAFRRPAVAEHAAGHCH